MTERLANTPRIYILLAIAAALGALAVGYPFMERADARAERARVLQMRDVYESDLEAIAPEKDAASAALAAKQAELAARQAEAESAGRGALLPGKASRQDANAVGARLISYASSRSVTLNEYETSQATAVVGEHSLPAVSYTLVATGDAAELSGLLDIAAQTPTGLVERVRLTAEESGGWMLELVLKVAYGEQS
ncbi:MAG: hypothetical protein FJ319_07600 [SAR202 cluster bacterium]|nr:hypothetical protein [SAR202 cluster bacterium]